MTINCFRLVSTNRTHAADRVRTGAAVLFAVSLTTVLSACASMWSVGDTDYDCPGMPHGVVCKTPREVYKATNHRDALVTMEDNGKQKEAGDTTAGDDRNGALGAHASVTLPQPIQQPLPVLEPAKVMRIWVNSWIDQNGDLHYPGLLFTEVTSRRWAVGNIVSDVDAQVLTPVQIDDGGAAASPSVDTQARVVGKPPAVIQPDRSNTATAGGSPGRSQGAGVPGLPVPDATSGAGASGNASPFSNNFSGSSGNTIRPTTNWNSSSQMKSYLPAGQSGSASDFSPAS